MQFSLEYCLILVDASTNIIAVNEARIDIRFAPFDLSFGFIIVIPKLLSKKFKLNDFIIIIAINIIFIIYKDTPLFLAPQKQSNLFSTQSNPKSIKSLEVGMYNNDIIIKWTLVFNFNRLKSYVRYCGELYAHSQYS